MSNDSRTPSFKEIRDKMIPVHVKPKKILVMNKSVEPIVESTMPKASKDPVKNSAPTTPVKKPKTTNYMQLFAEEFSNALKQEEERNKKVVSEQKSELIAEELELQRKIEELEIQKQNLLNKKNTSSRIFATEETNGKNPPPVSTPQLVAKTVSSMKKATPKQDDDSGISENVRKELEAIKKATNEFKRVVGQLQASSSHGGGEVNLRFLDDVDTTNLVNGATLVWDASKNKFVFGGAVIPTVTPVFESSSFAGPLSVVTLPTPATTNSSFVYINGVQMIPQAGYTIASTLLTLASTIGPTDVLTIRTPSFSLPPGSTFDYADAQFTGNGSQTNYTITQPSTTNNSIVTINGIVQVPSVAYTISGTNLVFTTPVSPGDVVDVRSPNLVSSTNNFTKAYNQFVGTGSQSVYTLTNPATTDDVFVAINGVAQIGGSAFNVLGTTLTFVAPVLPGDVIDIRIPVLT